MKNKAGGQPAIYYGWWLMLVCVLIQGVGYGTSLYLYSVMIGGIGEEFKSGRFLLMVGVSGMLLLTGLMSPKIGSLLDRFPIKKILVAGGLVMGAGFILMSFAPHISVIILCYAVFIALGMTILSPLSCSVLLTRWFSRYRGLALGISALGTQLGGVVFPPIIALSISHYDWRITAAGLGVFIMVFIPLLAWFFVYDHPADKQLQKDGRREPSEGDVSGKPKPDAEVIPKNMISLKDILTSRNFIIVVIFMGFLSIVYSGLLANLSLVAIDKGQTMERGAFLVSLLAMVGMVSSPVMGRVSDLLSVGATLATLCLTATIALFLYLRADSFAMLIAATVFFGFFGGGVVPVWSAVISRLYDSRIYGRVFGASTALVYSMAAFSAPAIGLLYDLTASYQITFLILLVASLLVVLCAFGVKPQAREIIDEALDGENEKRATT